MELMVDDQYSIKVWDESLDELWELLPRKFETLDQAHDWLKQYAKDMGFHLRSRSRSQSRVYFSLDTENDNFAYERIVKVYI